MASWVTHLIIADIILKNYPAIHRRGFCVGSIAPDCNIENEDFTAFTPPREITHFMRGKRKSFDDCEDFFDAHISPLPNPDFSREQEAFLLGYYAHLITDAAHQQFIRDDRRVKNVWQRILADPVLKEKSAGLNHDWDSAKKLLPASVRMREIHAMEAAYLKAHPESGYLTEILPLENFPDYLAFLPKGAIQRKIGVMGYLPKEDPQIRPVSLSQSEFDKFITETAVQVTARFAAHDLWG